MPDVNSAERDEQLGNRLFFYALDWILRHELAHLELDHHTRIADKSLTNLDAETEADLQASKWLKGEFNADQSRPAGEKPTSDELRLEWRALAAGIGLIWVGLFEDAFRCTSPEHPPIAERIFALFGVLIWLKIASPLNFLPIALKLGSTLKGIGENQVMIGKRRQRTPSLRQSSTFTVT